ncbi:MAG: ABC transporter permease subunit, partial [Betaproteobacteria bacterium]
MSAAEIFTPIPPRNAPQKMTGAVAWVRRNLFADWVSSIATLAILGVFAYVIPEVVQWGLIHAVWKPDNEACREAAGVGACWGMIAEKYRLIIFGRYPFDQQWRPLIATVLMVVLLVASCTRPLWSKWLIVAWIAVLAAFFILMKGGLFGLVPVETSRWGGLPLTMMLSTLGIACAFPLAILVALGRRSHLPAIRSLCVVYVELIRGVPLISVLFMASFMFPLFMPQGTQVDVLLRVFVGITLFAAAYLAEVVRGGLQA